MSYNVHYCGKIVGYNAPKRTILNDDIYTDKKRKYIYTGKQEIKITDSVFFALQNPLNNLYLVTLTYQWKPEINYGLKFRKKANTHLNRFLKFLRDKKDVKRYVGVLETTKKRVPHYHIIIDCNIRITGYKRVYANKKNFKSLLWHPPKKSFTQFNEKKASRYWKTNETNFFNTLQTHWNTITHNYYRNSLDYERITKKDLRNNGTYKITRYLTKYFTKELKIPVENRFDFGVRNYFISDKLRIKPLKISDQSFYYSDFIEIQKKAQKKNSIYWNKCSNNENYTENIQYYKDTYVYWINPKDLPPINTAITRITINKPLKTLYDRIKYIENETI